MPKLNFTQWKAHALLPLPRAGSAAGFVNGEIVVAGGSYWRDDKKFWTDQVNAFDLKTDRWSTKPPMPKPCGDPVSAVIGDTLYVFGGGAEGAAYSTAWSFRNNVWSELPQLALPAPRRSAMAVVLDGTIYHLGGLTGLGSDFASATSTVWAAKPDGRWEEKAPMPGPPRFNPAVGVVSGLILVAGGCAPEKGAVKNLDEVLAYSPATNTWKLVGSLPVANRAAAGLADESGLVLLGGYTNSFEKGIVRYDLPTGEVRTLGQLPTGLAGHRFLSAGSRIFGVSGEDGVKMRFSGLIEAL